MRTLEVTVDLVEPISTRFTAGQFMQFKIGSVLRSYSIINVPDHNRFLKFCVGLLDNGEASDFFRSAKIGQELFMRGPSGIFSIENFSKNSFFVAGGVGIAPFCSMIPDMLARSYEGKAHLLFGVATEDDIFYFDRFNHLHNLYPNFTFTPIVSRPQLHWPGETGRVTTYLDVAYEYYKDYLYYICGSSEMVKDARDLLLKKGQNIADIKLEIFT